MIRWVSHDSRVVVYEKCVFFSISQTPPKRMDDRKSLCRCRFEATLHAALFLGLAMASLGLDAKSTGMLVCAFCGIVGCCMYLSRLLPKNRFRFGSKRPSSSSSSSIGHLDGENFSEDEDSRRPRWERRWLRTEMRKRKKKDSKFDRKRESIEIEARERSMHLLRAAEKADEERRKRESEMVEGRRAWEAAESARKELQTTNEAERKRNERHRLEEKAKAKNCLIGLDAVYARAVSSAAMAELVDKQLTSLKAAAPPKRRSHKSQSKKKVREKIAEKTTYAESLRRIALDDYHDACDEREKCLRLVGDDEIPEFPLSKPPRNSRIIETPDEIRRLIDQVRRNLPVDRLPSKGGELYPAAAKILASDEFSGSGYDTTSTSTKSDISLCSLPTGHRTL